MMATPSQRDAYRRVIHLIMEEIAGCELDPKAMPTVELMNVVRELESRIIEGPNVASTPHAAKHEKFDRKYHPKRKNAQAWRQGPLATVSTGAVTKPPWFSDKD